MSDDDTNIEAETTGGVSAVQDVLVTAVVALIGTAAALGVYLKAGFGLVPALCVGSGLFIWLLSAHFLITRMRLKKLIDQRLARLDRDVVKLKKEAEITELLAEGHNELVSGQGALEKAVTLIAQKMDGYDQRLKKVYKLAKQGGAAANGAETDSLKAVNAQFIEMQGELNTLGRQIKGLKNQFDDKSALQFDLIRAELEVLEMVVRQVSTGSSDVHQQFCERALQVIDGLRQLPVMRQEEETGRPLTGSGQFKAVEQIVANEQSSAGSGSAISVPVGDGSLLSQALFNAAPEARHQARETSQQAKDNLHAEMPQKDGPLKDNSLKDSPLKEGPHKMGMETASPNAAISASGTGGPGVTDGMGANVVSTQPNTGKIENILTVVNEAIEADRIELFLQPVVKLPGREIVNYEALSRLRSDTGQLILPKDYAQTADKAGLTPIIDNQIILMVIKVVQKLIGQGKAKRVFCPLSLSSLRDADFFAEFMDFMEANGWLNEHLVFQLSQENVDQAGPFERARLKDIAGLGFVFCLADVTRLDLDFRVLGDQQFRYIKFGADLLLGDVLNARAEIHPADLGPYLERLNIQLVIDQVTREPIVRQLRDHNVHYAQGNLFCTPKPVRRDVFDGVPRANVPSENVA